MFAYIVRRFAVAIPTILILIVLSFVLMYSAPGNPFNGEKIPPPEVLANLQAKYGLDQPYWKQITNYVWNVVAHFDFGPSFKYKDRSVNDIIAQGFPVTLTYGFWSFVVAVVVGVSLGVLAAIRHNTWIDYLAVGFSITEAFSRLASEDRPTEFSLTDDQMAVLRAVAMGACAEELAGASYLYGSYTTLERSICTMFRTRTITQAAIMAARVGLLTNAPLTKADILVGISQPSPNRVIANPNATSMRRLIKMRNVAPGEGATQTEATAAPK